MCDRTGLAREALNDRARHAASRCGLTVYKSNADSFVLIDTRDGCCLASNLTAAEVADFCDYVVRHKSKRRP
jgi:hypothetical protein